MEREGFLSGRAAGDRVGAGFGAARPDAGQGDRSRYRVGIDEARRRGNGNPGNEDDVLIMNDSPSTEPAWQESWPQVWWGFDCRYCHLKSRGGGASAVFEELRSLNSRRKESRLGTKNGRKRKRIVEEEEEDDYIYCDDDEDEQNEHIDIDDEDDDPDDSESEADGGVPSQVEEDGPDQVENEIEGTSDGNSANWRSARLKKARKVKDVNSLYN